MLKSDPLITQSTSGEIKFNCRLQFTFQLYSCAKSPSKTLYNLISKPPRIQILNFIDHKFNFQTIDSNGITSRFYSGKFWT